VPDDRAGKVRLGDVAASFETGPAGIALRVDPFSCEGCGVCQLVCPAGAIELLERTCGEWMISDTRCGPMVHARLGVGGENSGKLVSIVRREARRIAEESGRTTIVVDGPPGLGCPVIASIGGASLVLVVTEPTVAGAHDLDRVLSLGRHFAVPAMVCVNRWDLNPEMTERIEAAAREAGARVAGRIRYDRAVTLAQMQETAVAESNSPAATDIRRVWENLEV
jgi:MinD superfamily P-loop ATPase